MRLLLCALVVLTAGLGADARAQGPLPFWSEPDFAKRLHCARDYVRSVERQAAVLEKLRAAGPEAVGRLCTLIEAGGDWLGGELPDGVRQELRSRLGLDIDVERIMAQCRAGQDSLERDLAARLAEARAELVRCDGTI